MADKKDIKPETGTNPEIRENRKFKITKKKQNIASTLRFIYIPLLIVAFIVVFFTFYNNFLMDSYMKSLHTSLGSIEVDKTAGAEILLEVSMLDNMAEQGIGSSELAQLNMTKRMLERGDSSAMALLESQKNDREKNQNPVSIVLDTASMWVTDTIDSGLSFFDKSRNIGTDSSQTIALPAETRALLKDATAFENDRKFIEAAEMYSEYLEKTMKYRQYTSVGWLAVKLKMGYSYFRAADIETADKHFEEIISLKRKSDEADIAKRLREKIADMRKIRSEVEKQVAFADKLADAQKAQTAYYEVGKSYIKIMDYESAAVYLEKAAKVKAETKTADEAYYKLAEVLTQLGRYDDARRANRMIKRSHSSVSFQLASSYQKEGRHEDALKAFEQAAKAAENEDGGDAIRSMAMLSSGYTLLHDLHDPDAASKFFDQAKEFSGDEIAKMIEEQMKTQVKEIKIRRFGTGSKQDFFKELDEFMRENGGETYLTN